MGPCCKPPCDGSTCHVACVVSATDREECGCHCHGEYHGIGYKAAGGAKTPLRERVANARRVIKLRRLSDDDLAARAAALDWDDKAAVASVMRETDRRDRAAALRTRARSKSLDAHTQHAEAAQAQYQVAEEETRGHMLSKAGQRAGVRELDLWNMNERTARKYASEELNEWWDAHPRITKGKIKADARANRRALEDAHEAEHGAYAHLTYATMRRQDFDTSEPLSLLDEAPIRAAQPTKPKAPDTTGTPDMFE